MDEQGFTGLQLGAFDERDVGRGVGGRVSGGVAGAHRLGDGVERGGRADGEVGEGAGLGAACDAQAGMHGDAGANRIDHAGEVHANREGWFGFELVLALEHQQVGEVEAGRLDPDADFAGAGFRQGEVFQGDSGEIRRQSVAHDCTHLPAP